MSDGEEVLTQVDEGVVERLARLEAMVGVLSEKVDRLCRQVENDQRHIVARLSAVERWQVARNAVAQHEEVLAQQRRQWLITILGIGATALFSGGGLLAILMSLLLR